MKNTATVIIPTTGSPELIDAVESVLKQTIPTTCYVVCDGMDHYTKVAALAIEAKWTDNPNFKFCCIPINVGAKGFYGHRIYAAFTHLVDTEYVLYLDQDCWLDSNHVETCISIIKKTNSHWSYSLRKICDKSGNYICNDDCESLGKWNVFSGDYSHIDTNCYCIKTQVAIKLAQVWHGGWGQDRFFLNALSQYFNNYDCTGIYTVNYRLAGNEGSVKPEFFHYGNEVMTKKYNGVFPWRKRT